MVDATTGEFEAGFEAGGQTREHAILVRSLGVRQMIIAVNKVDTVSYTFAELLVLCQCVSYVRIMASLKLVCCRENSCCVLEFKKNLNLKRK